MSSTRSVVLRTVSYLVAILVAFSLTACGNPLKNVMDSSSSEASEDSFQAQEVYVPEESSAEEATSAEDASEEPVSVDIPWETYVDLETDNEGYVIRKQITISPWISEDDTTALSAAWTEVGKNNAFPSPSEMGFTGNAVSNYYTSYIDYDEIYYAVGYLEAYNETNGWDITQDNTRGIYFSLLGANQYMTMRVMYGNGARNYYDIYAPSDGVFGTKGGGNNPYIRVTMHSNEWGPTPFVIAFAIDKTPNHPNGDPSIDDCVFQFGDSQFFLAQQPEA